MSTRLQLAAQFAAYAGARSNDLQALFDEVCRVAAQGVEAPFAKLLVFQPEERAFLLQAGVGWREGLVGEAWFDADASTAAGFAWECGQSVLSNDLLREDRFRPADLLVEYRFVRSINVVVPGDQRMAFGILEVESPHAGAFTVHDADFLQILAHSLAAAIATVARRTSEEQRTAQHIEEGQVSLREMQHRVRNDLQGILSLLHREARTTVEASQHESFGRVSRRVQALAALYDHLLGASIGDSIDMGDYLRGLCGKIVHAENSPRAQSNCKSRPSR